MRTSFLFLQEIQQFGHETKIAEDGFLNAAGLALTAFSTRFILRHGRFKGRPRRFLSARRT